MKRYLEKAKLPMNPHKKTTIGILLALLAFAPGEWPLVREWLYSLSPWLRWLIMVVFILVVALGIANAFAGPLKDFCKYFVF